MYNNRPTTSLHKKFAIRTSNVFDRPRKMQIKKAIMAKDPQTSAKRAQKSKRIYKQSPLPWQLSALVNGNAIKTKP